MTQIINNTGGFVERVTIDRVDALPGSFHIHVEMQYADSRNPDAWRTVYRTTCEQWALESFGREIYEAVVQSE
jgi:hypothetical protein